MPEKSRPKYTPLHFNIEDFCKRVVPTPEEAQLKHEVITGVKFCVKKIYAARKRVKAQVFGSFVNGLSTWNSDVDIVITGVMEPDRISGGYDQSERRTVSLHLDKVAVALRRYKRLEVNRMQIIRHARIPIIKMRTRANVTVDISLGDELGPRAANYVIQQARAHPPLRPLVLVLKSYLKGCGLNEVATGGLSSYSLTHMAIAHLLEEAKAGRDVFDLGETLYSFLLRYGDEFSYVEEAVSVASGGIVSKAALGAHVAEDDAAVLGDRLLVDDPLTGRDVSSGSYRIHLVRSAFQRAARRLESLAAGRRMTDASVNYLSALFDVSKTLRRSTRLPGDDDYLLAPRHREVRVKFDDEDMFEEAGPQDRYSDSDGDVMGDLYSEDASAGDSLSFDDGDELYDDEMQRPTTTVSARTGGRGRRSSDAH